MTLPSALWAEVSRGFDAALALALEARATWLSGLEQQRPELAVHIRRMLDAHERPAVHDPLQGAAAARLLADALEDTLGGRERPLEAGRMVGPYRLVAPLGEGGMAAVWLAEQTVNVQRRVALKLPHHGLEDAAAAARRYAKERDLLAGLEHAHIARLYDAGVSADGQPYLAMEWVDGVTICRFADEQRLDVAARVALFRQVLDAVHFAHARLVIHRDIKPSNILVTADGQVKLLDFGIAQLLEMPDAANAGSMDVRALTPDCASPEQLAGSTLGTASDVYSLGVVLYEMLCGQRPYRLGVEARNDARACYDTLAKMTVPAPSAAAIDDRISAARQTDPRALRRRLAGDLDAIVLKTLQWEPGDRYESVESLRAELTRWQTGWPVRARRGTARYRVGRFLQRHRVEALALVFLALALAIGLGVTAGAVVSIALAVGLGAALWQTRQARQEARRARAVQAFLLGLFSANDPEQARGRDVTAKELLDRGAKRLDAELQDQPAVLARLHREIGGIYIQLGSNVSAAPHLERAIALYASIGLEGSEEGIDAAFNLTEVLEEEMQFDQARAAAARCLRLAARHFGPRNRWKLPIVKLTSWMDMQDGRVQQGVDALTAALDEAERLDPRPTVQTLKARSTLANACFELGRFAKARTEFSRLLQEQEGLPGYEVTDSLADRYNLARARYNMREFGPTQDELAVLLPEMDRHIGPQHDRTIKARALWAQTLAELGRYDEAIAIQQANLQAAAKRGSMDEEVLNLQKLTLAKLYKIAVRPLEGIPMLREGLSFYDAKRREPTWLGEVGRRLLGELLLQAGEIDNALATFAMSRTRAQQIEDFATHTSYADLLQAQALGLHMRGVGEDGARAVDLLTQASTIYSQALGEDNPGALRCMAQLCWMRALLTNSESGAVAAFEEASDRYAATVPATHVARAELTFMTAELALRSGAPEAAAASRAEAAQAWRDAMGRPFIPAFTALH